MARHTIHFNQLSLRGKVTQILQMHSPEGEMEVEVHFAFDKVSAPFIPPLQRPDRLEFTMRVKGGLAEECLQVLIKDCNVALLADLKIQILTEEKSS